eukprot:GHVO01066795.1.p1 GENE.GHVO01066795.1~~GHVO01066795.1.p1  ORF type:complete len:120 (-),score=27.43 GHVO01066795.1:251-610(-)
MHYEFISWLQDFTFTLDEKADENNAPSNTNIPRPKNVSSHKSPPQKERCPKSPPQKNARAKTESNSRTLESLELLREERDTYLDKLLEIRAALCERKDMYNSQFGTEALCIIEEWPQDF